MSNFILLEGGYMVIAAFFLAITAFVTTRKFMEKGLFKKIFPAVFLFFVIAIGIHHYITIDRMKTVQKAFHNNEVIICESKDRVRMSRSVLIEKKNNWKVEDFMFVSDDYVRGFHSARCVVDIYNKPKEEEK
jgi:hypothetical protein